MYFRDQALTCIYGTPNMTNRYCTLHLEPAKTQLHYKKAVPRPSQPSFFFTVQGNLRSRANFVTIQHEPGKAHVCAKKWCNACEREFCVKCMSFAHNMWELRALCTIIHVSVNPKFFRPGEEGPGKKPSLEVFWALEMFSTMWWGKGCNISQPAFELYKL